MPPPSREPPKLRGRLGADQAKRRQQALDRQKQARRDALAALRQVSEHQEEEPRENEEYEPSPGKARRAINRREKAKEFSRQLMSPAWLVEAPTDLGSGEWLVMPRPDGKRCLVIADRGWTTTRTHKNGQQLHKFKSPLPGGGAGAHGAGETTVLDCVFQAETGVYYILDAMCWRGYDMYECGAEFRLYWAREKLAESTAGGVTAETPFPFYCVPYAVCDASSVEQAYTHPFGFKKDGLLFIHKEAHYWQGSTPLALQWKDAACSEYPVDSPDSDAPNLQTICLELTESGDLVSCDDPPCILGQATEEIKGKATPGSLLKFSILDVDIQSEAPTVLGMTFLRVVPHRLVADQWSRILYQYHARTRPVTIQEIGEALQTSMRQ